LPAGNCKNSVSKDYFTVPPFEFSHFEANLGVFFSATDALVYGTGTWHCEKASALRGGERKVTSLFSKEVAGLPKSVGAPLSSI
jgi:hypothetical protein